RVLVNPLTLQTVVVNIWCFPRTTENSCNQTSPKEGQALGLLMRIRRPRTTANIFRSGKMICTGATSMEECRQATRRHARILQKAGFPVRILNFRIINCVCTSAYCRLIKAPDISLSDQDVNVSVFFFLQ
uniref:TATA box-binding protein-like 1 n=1 Tax=Oryzias melastigma TaxID=30732 RepID=A0A3B3BPQ6_ORYME